VLLRRIAKELNLGQGNRAVSPATMQALLERPGVERLVKDEISIFEELKFCELEPL
jgi:hypothetical protein